MMCEKMCVKTILCIISDLPSVLSGDRLFMIDPHEKYFLYKGDKTTGYSWHLQQRKQIMDSIPNQFAPFQGLLGDFLFLHSRII